MVVAGLLTAFPVQALPTDDTPASSDIVIVERHHSSEPIKDPLAEVTASVIMQEIILQAMSLIGVRYRWGGNTPETGLDCSGFIRHVFQQSANVVLPRTAYAMSQIGKSIGRDELQPGDLVFFNTLRRQFSHVGIYLGDNRFIHAPSTGKTITVTNMNHRYWTSRYNGARRVNQEAFSPTIIKTARAENDLSQIHVSSYQKKFLKPELVNKSMAKSKIRTTVKITAQDTAKQKKRRNTTKSGRKKS
jgi:hypothetical protein